MALSPPAARAEVPFDPPGTYSTSWLGNTCMDAAGHKNVTEELADVCLSPNGKLFTAGYAETWGGGAEYKTGDGGFVARYDRFESGFGDPVKCVAADANFVFWGTPGKGILRSAHGGGGHGSYTTFLPGKIITGLFARNGKLYVSNFSDGKIHVYDTGTMTEDRSWPCLQPTRLTIDHAGNVWAIRWDAASTQKPHEGSIWWGEKIVSFSPNGTRGPEITDFEKPLALTVNNGGQLLVGGLNRHSQVWIYNINGKTVSMSSCSKTLPGQTSKCTGGARAACAHPCQAAGGDDKIPQQHPKTMNPNPRLSSFVGGREGQWKTIVSRAVTGEALSAVQCVDMVAENVATLPAGAAWVLRGVTSNERYVTRPEKEQLVAKSPALGRPEADCAVLIPIRKNAQWWALTQDERREIFEAQSHHTQIGLEYLPAVARRLHHCRDLGEAEPFDFLTWFEFANADTAEFDKLLARLRASEEWQYVEREVEVRLMRNQVR